MIALAASNVVWKFVIADNGAFVALNKVKPLEMLWSPVAGKYNETGDTAQLETNLESLFCNLSHPVRERAEAAKQILDNTHPSYPLCSEVGNMAIFIVLR